jgi:hypothetical protein
MGVGGVAGGVFLSDRSVVAATLSDPGVEAFSQRKRSVDVGHWRVAVIDEGTRDPIVLLHGCPFHAFEWRDVIPTLAAHHRVIAPDLPLHDKGEPALVRIDPAANAIAATIVLPDRLCQGYTASDDAIWVCASDALVRVDPATNEITDTVPIKGVQAFYRPAFGGGMVWALGSTSKGGDTVIRLAPPLILSRAEIALALSTMDAALGDV